MVQGGDSVNFRTGPFIDITSFEHASLHNLYLYATCIGVRVTGGQSVYITNVTNHAYKPGANCHAFYLSGNETGISGPGGSGPFTLDIVKFQNVITDGPDQGSCYRIADRVHTVWWNNTTCEALGSAIKSDCRAMNSAFKCPGFFTLDDFEAEYFGTRAENLIDLTDTVAGFKMTQGWLRGVNGGNFSNNLISVQQGRFTSAGSITTVISDSWLKGSGGDSILINAPGAVTITGNHIYGSAGFNSNLGAITLAGNVKGATITGNVLCGGDWLGDVSWQPNAGVRILSGADYVTVSGNAFQGDVNPPAGKHNGCVSGVANASGGTHISIANNVGP